MQLLVHQAIMDTYSLSAIYLYPVKSLGGFAVGEAVAEERGLRHDRRWMLVDARHRFLTQRTDPRMALLQTAIADGRLVISHKHGAGHIAVPLQPDSGHHLTVQVWNDTCAALAPAPEADRWLSEYLGHPCRLVYMPDSTRRPVDARYAVADNHTSFSDGYPFLLVGQASLDALNRRLDAPLPMNRFRPNLVVAGSAPHAEDGWHEISVGETVFFGVKPCARCLVTATDQDTGAVGREPLQTLGRYRRTGNKIYFGQNLVSGRQGGTIRLGDAVAVRTQQPWPLPSPPLRPLD